MIQPTNLYQERDILKTIISQQLQIEHQTKRERFRQKTRLKFHDLIKSETGDWRVKLTQKVEFEKGFSLADPSFNQKIYAQFLQNFTKIYPDQRPTLMVWMQERKGSSIPTPDKTSEINEVSAEKKSDQKEQSPLQLNSSEHSVDERQDLDSGMIQEEDEEQEESMMMAEEDINGGVSSTKKSKKIQSAKKQSVVNIKAFTLPKEELKSSNAVSKTINIEKSQPRKPKSHTSDDEDLCMNDGDIF